MATGYKELNAVVIRIHAVSEHLTLQEYYVTNETSPEKIAAVTQRVIGKLHHRKQFWRQQTTCKLTL